MLFVRFNCCVLLFTMIDVLFYHCLLRVKIKFEKVREQNAKVGERSRKLEEVEKVGKVRESLRKLEKVNNYQFFSGSPWS